MGLLEGALELVQLIGGEGRPVATVLFLAGRVVRLHAAWLVVAAAARRVATALACKRHEAFGVISRVGEYSRFREL